MAKFEFHSTKEFVEHMMERISEFAAGESPAAADAELLKAFKAQYSELIPAQSLNMLLAAQAAKDACGENLFINTVLLALYNKLLGEACMAY